MSSKKHKRGLKPFVTRMVAIDLGELLEPLMDVIDEAINGSPEADPVDKNTLIDLLLRDVMDVQRNPTPSMIEQYIKSVEKVLKEHYIDPKYIDKICVHWISLTLFFTAQFIRNKCHDISQNWSIAKVQYTSVYIYPIDAVKYRKFSSTARTTRRTLRAALS